MRLASLSRRTLLILAVPALLLAGCGGGGGGSGGDSSSSTPTVATFSGAYWWQLWGGHQVGPVNTTQWGFVDSDGAGMVTSGIVSNNTAGIVGGPTAVPPLPYAVDSAGRVELMVGGAMLEGGVSADGSLLGLAQVTPGVDPSLAILPKGGGGPYSDMSLNGDYHVCAFFYNAAGEWVWWGGSVTFDGAGNVPAFSTGINHNGVTSPPGAPAALGTYTVGPLGAVTWTGPGSVMTGGIGLGGEVVVLTGSAAASNFQIVVVLIPKTAGLSDATFSGKYHFVSVRADNGGPSYQVSTGTASSNGMGSWTSLGGTTNEDGAIAAIPPGGLANYTVAPDGALAIPAAGFEGAVAPSGRCAVLAGGSSAGSDPQLLFFFR